MPDDDVAGTVEELIRKYQGDDLAAFKREATRKEYQGRVRRIRPAFGKLRYTKTEVQALLPGQLSALAITKHLHDNRERAASANKDVQLLSRIFRLARIRWGLTTFNPCDAIEYLPRARATSTSAMTGMPRSARPPARSCSACWRSTRRPARATE